MDIAMFMLEILGYSDMGLVCGLPIWLNSMSFPIQE